MRIVKKIKENIAEILFVAGFINIDTAFFMQNIRAGLISTGISLIVLGILLAHPKIERR